MPLFLTFFRCRMELVQQSTAMIFESTDLIDLLSPLCIQQQICVYVVQRLQKLHGSPLRTGNRNYGHRPPVRKPKMHCLLALTLSIGQKGCDNPNVAIRIAIRKKQKMWVDAWQFIFCLLNNLLLFAFSPQNLVVRHLLCLEQDIFN